MEIEPSSYPAGGIPPVPSLAESRTLEIMRQKNAARRAASLLVNPLYLDGGSTRILEEPTPVTFYTRSAKIHYSPQAGLRDPKMENKKGSQIGNMTDASRRRASFAFLNAPCEWGMMLTLTRREQPENPKADFDKFLRQQRNTWNIDAPWGWIMEYQRRGVVHHHVFYSVEFMRQNDLGENGWVEPVNRNGTIRRLLRGSFDTWAVLAWIHATGDRSPEFRAFQQGGILELFDAPDAAARYIAKESGKRHQKQLPPGVAGGHRWWWLSKSGKAEPIGRAYLTETPLRWDCGIVFEASVLLPHIKHPKTLSAELQKRKDIAPERAAHILAR